MPIAGYNASVFVSGTSTATTGEATTNTSGDIYQITDTDKQIMDPDVTPVVYDGVSVISASTYTINYLEGTISLGSTPAGAVTVDYNSMTDSSKGAFLLNRQLEGTHITRLSHCNHKRS